MNFEHVSVENRKKSRQSYLPGSEQSTTFSHQNRRTMKIRLFTKNLKSPAAVTLRAVLRAGERLRVFYSGKGVNEWLVNLQKL